MSDYLSGAKFQWCPLCDGNIRKEARWCRFCGRHIANRFAQDQRLFPSRPGERTCREAGQWIVNFQGLCRSLPPDIEERLRLERWPPSMLLMPDPPAPAVRTLVYDVFITARRLGIDLSGHLDERRESLLAVICGSLDEEAELRSEEEGGKRICQFCAEPILPDAAICRHCGSCDDPPEENKFYLKETQLDRKFLKELITFAVAYGRVYALPERADASILQHYDIDESAIGNLADQMRVAGARLAELFPKSSWGHALTSLGIETPLPYNMERDVEQLVQSCSVQNLRDEEEILLNLILDLSPLDESDPRVMRRRALCYMRLATIALVRHRYSEYLSFASEIARLNALLPDRLHRIGFGTGKIMALRMLAPDYESEPEAAAEFYAMLAEEYGRAEGYFQERLETIEATFGAMIRDRRGSFAEQLEANHMICRAIMEKNAGNFAEAAKLVRTVLSNRTYKYWDVRNSVNDLCVLAGIYDAAGDLVEARETFEHAVGVADELQELSTGEDLIVSSASRARYAAFLSDQGELEGARAQFAAASDLRRAAVQRAIRKNGVDEIGYLAAGSRDLLSDYARLLKQLGEESSAQELEAEAAHLDQVHTAWYADMQQRRRVMLEAGL